MAKITYTEKVNGLQSEAPANQKVSAGDMNSIKTSVNALYDLLGYEFHQDAGLAPIVLTTDWTRITIGDDGPNTELNYKPQGLSVSEFLWNGSAIVSGKVGDAFDLRFNWEFAAKSGNPTIIYFGFDLGTSTPPTSIFITRRVGADKTIPFDDNFAFPIFASQAIQDNTCRIFARVDTGSITIAKRDIFIKRTFSLV